MCRTVTALWDSRTVLLAQTLLLNTAAAAQNGLAPTGCTTTDEGVGGRGKGEIVGARATAALHELAPELAHSAATPPHWRLGPQHIRPNYWHVHIAASSCHCQINTHTHTQPSMQPGLHCSGHIVVSPYSTKCTQPHLQYTLTSGAAVRRNNKATKVTVALCTFCTALCYSCGLCQVASVVVSSGAKCVQRSNSASVPMRLVSTKTSARRA